MELIHILYNFLNKNNSSKQRKAVNAVIKTLDSADNEHSLKLLALYSKGVELFRTVEEFHHWLNKPFWFGTDKPIDCLATTGGIDKVMDELVKMAYGDAV